MKNKINFNVNLNNFFLLLLIIISLNCCNNGKAKKSITETEIVIRTGSLVDTLNSMIGYDHEKRTQLINFINSELEHNGKSIYEEEAYGFYGVTYSYNKNSKYLFVTETEFGGGGSSFEWEKTYIFDTELVKLIPIENIFINANTPNPSFNKLVMEYLLKNKGFNWIEQELLPKAEEPITDYGFSLFYSQKSIGMKWNEGSLAANAAGAFEIVLPYSKAQEFLTQTGKEIFK
jgi:hypothetical protein